MAGLESLEQLMSKDTDAYLSAMSDDDDEACRTPGKKRQQLVKNLPDDQLALVNLLKHDLGEMMDKKIKNGFKKFDAKLNSLAKGTDTNFVALKHELDQQKSELVEFKNQFQNQLNTNKQEVQSALKSRSNFAPPNASYRNKNSASSSGEEHPETRRVVLGGFVDNSPSNFNIDFANAIMKQHITDETAYKVFSFDLFGSDVVIQFKTVALREDFWQKYRELIHHKQTTVGDKTMKTFLNVYRYGDRMTIYNASRFFFRTLENAQMEDKIKKELTISKHCDKGLFYIDGFKVGSIKCEDGKPVLHPHAKNIKTLGVDIDGFWITFLSEWRQ